MNDVLRSILHQQVHRTSSISSPGKCPSHTSWRWLLESLPQIRVYFHQIIRIIDLMWPPWDLSLLSALSKRHHYPLHWLLSLLSLNCELLLFYQNTSGQQPWHHDVRESFHTIELFCSCILLYSLWRKRYLRMQKKNKQSGLIWKKSINRLIHVKFIATKRWDLHTNIQ